MAPYPDQIGVRFAPIPGHDGYAASDDGFIWSLWAERRSRHGEVWHRLAIRLDEKGYQRVSFGPRGKRSSVRVHSLVLKAFRGEPEPGQEACHANGDRADNRLSNLRWDTHQANIADSIAAGTFVYRRGELNGRAKLSPDDVAAIHRLRRAGQSQSSVAKRFGVTKTTIRLIEQGKVWRELHPDFPAYLEATRKARVERPTDTEAAITESLRRAAREWEANVARSPSDFGFPEGSGNAPPPPAGYLLYPDGRAEWLGRRD